MRKVRQSPSPSHHKSLCDDATVSGRGYKLTYIMHRSATATRARHQQRDRIRRPRDGTRWTLGQWQRNEHVRRKRRRDRRHEGINTK